MPVLTKDAGSQTTEYSIPLDAKDSRLPYHHSSFPEASNAASARIYMASSRLATPRRHAKKGDTTGLGRLHSTGNNGSKAQRQILDLKLPDILAMNDEAGPHENRTSSDLPRGSARYVLNQKALLKLKGLKYEAAYIHSRFKLDSEGTRLSRANSDIELDRSLQEYRRKKSTLTASALDDMPEMRLPCIHMREDLREDKRSESARGTICSRCGLEEIGRQNTRDPEGSTLTEEELGTDDDTQGNMEKRFNEVIEEYLETPGVKQKQRHVGRKLGDIVKPIRLIELLRAREPLKMENCFNYYP